MSQRQSLGLLGSSRHTPGFAVDEFDPSTYSLLSSTTNDDDAYIALSNVRLSAMSSSRVRHMQRARSLSPSKVAEQWISPTTPMISTHPPYRGAGIIRARRRDRLGYFEAFDGRQKLVTRRMRLM